MLDRSVGAPRMKPAVEGCCGGVVHAPLLIGAAAERESEFDAADGSPRVSARSQGCAPVSASCCLLMGVAAARCLLVWC